MGRFLLPLALTLLFSGAIARAAGPVFAVMGGFRSCRPDPGLEDGRAESYPHTMVILQPFEEMLKSLPATEDGRFFVSCFDGSLALNGSNLLRYAVVRKVGDHFELESSAATVRETQVRVGADGRLNPSDAFYEALAAAAGDSPLYLIGHSHGGWLAMQSVLRLAPTVEIRGLYTIDPISRVGCTPLAFVRAEAFRHPLRGCDEVPSDFSSKELRRISRRVRGHWLNFYQTSYAYLHSGPLSALSASRNIEVTEFPPRSSPFDVDHRRICRSEGVWNGIARDLGADPGTAGQPHAPRLATHVSTRISWVSNFWRRARRRLENHGG